MPEDLSEAEMTLITEVINEVYDSYGVRSILVIVEERAQNHFNGAGALILGKKTARIPDQIFFEASRGVGFKEAAGVPGHVIMQEMRALYATKKPGFKP